MDKPPVKRTREGIFMGKKELMGKLLKASLNR